MARTLANKERLDLVRQLNDVAERLERLEARLRSTVEEPPRDLPHPRSKSGRTK